MESVVETVEIKKYSKYKDSGVQWLGSIPAHWLTVRSKRLFRERKERARNMDEQLTASQKYGIINQQEFMELETRRVTQVEFNRDILKHVETNDFVISMRSFQGGIEYSKFSGCISSAYVPLIPIKDVVPAFFKYLFKCNQYITALSSTSNLVRDGQAMRFENFSSVDLLIVPRQEQTLIARFLDRKTAQIGKAIAQKEKLIELLKERRQILIHNAVTKGLNPNVKMKDSGVESIGKIPEYWSTRRLKNVVKMLVSNVDKHSKPLELKVKLCNYVDVYKNDFITQAIEFMEATATQGEISQFKIEINDVIVTKDSEDWLDIGIPALVKYSEDNLICGYHLAILRPKDILKGSFLHRALESNYIKTQFSVKANGVTRFGVSHRAILSTFIAIPPKVEQKDISKFIEREVQKTYDVISIAKGQIEKLKEYKATLINSAVTGKIKVPDLETMD